MMKNLGLGPEVRREFDVNRRCFVRRKLCAGFQAHAVFGGGFKGTGSSCAACVSSHDNGPLSEHSGALLHARMHACTHARMHAQKLLIDGLDSIASEAFGFGFGSGLGYS